jgi:hypothetical protein
MLKNTEPKGASWELSLGLYPGILLGIRTYVEEDSDLYVLYLLFIDVAIEIFKN